MKHRLIAINLPQFHPFPENDEWWGKGFTEWTNVTKARPRFKGHYQPHLPADTGFYDLRLPEARNMQADMAREYGIYGFCYYHYWFNGKQLMERPVNDILKSGEPDFPFMLCWANENWSRKWNGGDQDILIKQNYSESDDINHIRWLCKNVFPDKRYIRIANKPVFSVYRTCLFPNLKLTAQLWRRVAKEEFNIDLYLMCADFPQSHYYPRIPKDYGMDASFDFQPIGINKRMRRIKYDRLRFWSNRIPVLRSRKWFRSYIDKLPDIYSYKEYVNFMKDQPFFPRRYPCVSPGFDNSPRRNDDNFICIMEGTPQLYEEWLDDVLSRFTPFSDEENFVFINAWNEWAEGNHIEPDQKWGRAYLEATRAAILRHN